MDSPFRYCSANPRKVVNMHKDYQKIMLSTAAIFLYSLSWYHRRRFRIDQDAMMFSLFGVGSLFSAYSWSEFIFSSPDIEAAMKNNDAEDNHHH